MMDYALVKILLNVAFWGGLTYAVMKIRESRQPKKKPMATYIGD